MRVPPGGPADPSEAVPRHAERAYERGEWASRRAFTQRPAQRPWDDMDGDAEGPQGRAG
jgi:hypothetical protein